MRTSMRVPRPGAVSIVGALMQAHAAEGVGLARIRKIEADPVVAHP